MKTKIVQDLNDRGNTYVIMHPGKYSSGNRYQLLYQYHKILAACNIQGERACEFFFNIKLHKANICGIGAITVLSYG